MVATNVLLPSPRLPVDDAPVEVDPAPAGPALLALADEGLDALADRLHDGVLQSLVVARYACDAAVRGGDVAVARDAVQSALVALRQDVWMLRPRGAHGLDVALAALASQRLSTGRPGLLLCLDGAVAALLPEAVSTVAYRLVQSVLSETSEVVVRLRRRGGWADLSVGALAPDAEGWSVRARAVGAELTVGTHVTSLLVPLPGASSAVAPDLEDVR